MKKAMKKAMVIGCPGCGKSTFSRALHEAVGLPLYHLDMMYWNADRSKVPKSVFMKRLSDVMEKEAWIIDGNFTSTLELRLQACDTVFFLDYPLSVCLEGLQMRKGKERPVYPGWKRMIRKILNLRSLSGITMRSAGRLSWHCWSSIPSKMCIFSKAGMRQVNIWHSCAVKRRDKKGDFPIRKSPVYFNCFLPVSGKRCLIYSI